MITARLYEFSLPLRKPLTTGVDVRMRNGFLVSLSDDQGRTGWGEASPLPGLGHDDPKRLQSEWSRIRPSFDVLELPESLSLEFLKSAGQSITSPALRFGVETALCRLMSVRSDRGWPLLLHSQAHPLVPCSGLISGPAESWPGQLTRIVDQGYTRVKIKMGRANLTQELKAFSALAESAPSNLAWRIDANQAWSVSETSTVLVACQGLALEYIEEPLKNHEDWPQALKLPHAKLALDEQLQRIHPRQLGGYSEAAAIILKPTFLGGMIKCWEWSEAAHEQNMACTLSSCFESGCGLMALAELHAALPGVQLAAGLDTGQWLSGDTLHSCFSVQNGVAEWSPGANGGPDVNPDSLKEVG